MSNNAKRHMGKRNRKMMLAFEPFEVDIGRNRKAYKRLAKAEFKAMNSRRLIVLQTMTGW